MCIHVWCCSAATRSFEDEKKISSFYYFSTAQTLSVNEKCLIGYRVKEKGKVGYEEEEEKYFQARKKLLQQFFYSFFLNFSLWMQSAFSLRMKKKFISRALQESLLHKLKRNTFHTIRVVSAGSWKLSINEKTYYCAMLLKEKIGKSMLHINPQISSSFFNLFTSSAELFFFSLFKSFFFFFVHYWTEIWKQNKLKQNKN